MAALLALGVARAAAPEGAAPPVVHPRTWPQPRPALPSNADLEARIAQVGGTILIIGVLSGFAQQIAIPSIFGKNLRVIGLSVGSRRMFEKMTSAIERNNMKPVIDRTVAFDAVPDALKLMQQGGHFGKIVIQFAAS